MFSLKFCFTSTSQVGLNLVTDRASRTPAPALASWLLHRLRVILTSVSCKSCLAPAKTIGFHGPKCHNLDQIVMIVAITQEKRVLLAKEGEHGNVIYIVPPICINEEDVTEVIFKKMMIIFFTAPKKML